MLSLKQPAPQFKAYYNSREQRVYSDNKGKIAGNKEIL